MTKDLGASCHIAWRCIASRHSIPARPSPRRERSSRVLFSCFRLALVQLHNGHAHTSVFAHVRTYGSTIRTTGEMPPRTGSQTFRVACSTCVPAMRAYVYISFPLYCVRMLPLVRTNARASDARNCNDAQQSVYNSLNYTAGVLDSPST